MMSTYMWKKEARRKKRSKESRERRRQRGTKEVSI